MSQILGIFLFFIALTSSAHEVGDYDVLSRVMEQSIEQLSPDKIVVKAPAQGKNVLEVRYDGQIIYLNRSAMLHAIGSIYDELGKDLGYEDKEALELSRRSIFQYLSQKTIDLAKTPFLFFKNIIFNFPEESRHLSLELPKLIESRGLGAFVVIATTQVAWEVIETAVSWAIGAGGAHAYCVVFNIALLRTVDNFRHVGQYLLSTGLNVSFRTRLRALIVSIKRDWVLGKRALKSLPEKSRINEKYVQELFSSLSLNRRVTDSNNRLIDSLISEDFKLIGDQNINSKERIWLGYQVNLGVHYLDTVLNELISSFMEKHYTGSRQVLIEKKNVYKLLWKLRKFQGYVHQQKEKLAMAVTVESVSLEHESKRASLIEMYRVYLESISSINNVISKANKLLTKKTTINDAELILLTSELEKRLQYIKGIQRKGIILGPTASCMKAVLF